MAEMINSSVLQQFWINWCYFHSDRYQCNDKINFEIDELLKPRMTMRNELPFSWISFEEYRNEGREIEANVKNGLGLVLCRIMSSSAFLFYMSAENGMKMRKNRLILSVLFLFSTNPNANKFVQQLRFKEKRYNFLCTTVNQTSKHNKWFNFTSISMAMPTEMFNFNYLTSIVLIIEHQK